MKNIIKITFIIIGTLVGAGFASGKEIFSFFLVYKIEGIIGVFVSSFIISLVVYRTLNICNKNNINSYENLCVYLGNKMGVGKYSNLLNNVVNIFLLVTFYIMISGFSSFLYQEFQLNKILGSCIILLFCYFTFLKNINGLIKISNYLIPFLIIFIICISFNNLNIIENYNNVFNNILVNIRKPMFMGIISSILYASYNCVLLIPVLVPLKKLLKNNNIINVAIINFCIFCILIFSVYNLLLQGDGSVFLLDMPIIQIVENKGYIFEFVYLIMIGISIFTTAISTGYSFLNNCSKSKKSYKRVLNFMLISAVFLSQISFSFLVDLLYPILGIIGVLEILILLKK